MTQQIDTIIVGAGLSGLTIAHKLRTSCYGHRFVLLEKSASTGGVIRSHKENGFIAEIGPHGFLDNCAESREILEECGLHSECIKSPLIQFVRYVLLNGELQLIPQTPLKIALAPLIPWTAKFRVLADLWKKPLGGQPTVAKWVSHRFGSALLPFADAVFTGTYAGDINKLTIDSVMPGVRKLEIKHGSLIRGMLAKARSSKDGNTGKPKKFTMPAMTSFPQGMEQLPQKLAGYLSEGDNLILNCNVQKITREQEKWQVKTEDTTYQADNIALAVPTNTAIELLRELDEAPPLENVPEASILTVVFGFGPGSTLPPGFGYLVPEQEQRFTLGTLFSSNMFPGRAPANHILFETLIGGRRHPERLKLGDDDLISRAFEDVKDILPLNGDPVYTKVLRPWGTIPQLEKDYPELLKWRNQMISRFPGLHICGFGWEGIGLNDMMKYGVRVAQAIRSGTEGKAPETQVKGVYF